MHGCKSVDIKFNFPNLSKKENKLTMVIILNGNSDIDVQCTYGVKLII